MKPKEACERVFTDFEGRMIAAWSERLLQNLAQTTHPAKILDEIIVAGVTLYTAANGKFDEAEVIEVAEEEKLRRQMEGGNSDGQSH